ncbi:histidine phosphatase family protein [Consotaella salsifontis]|uniref:Broad specificity phosphatase PhoE n=1 Tax=Consotaella salsifontis TaxID=1365950 RepID=A0A1T4PKY4_9HYPH|nr:histidine phosphatase family protein [Consotaella salsifontis]SJZ91548.1 Broad specificity phosphatase PhoE [Consotaella salsifontis]
MATLFFITHPEVVVDAATAIERWHLSPRGIDRMRAFAASPLLSGVAAIWSSAETKAIEAAGILAGARGCGISANRALGENDRSATGFLPPDEFERVAGAFFAQPDVSVRGWEKAADAQARVRRAVEEIVAGHGEGDLAIVAHGAVGTLLLCALTGKAISRAFDQPFQGHFWQARLPDLVPDHGWRPIAPREPDF